jgi:hypothetical protein
MCDYPILRQQLQFCVCCFAFIVTSYKIQLTLIFGKAEVMDNNHTTITLTVVLRTVRRTDRVMNLTGNLEGIR